MLQLRSRGEISGAPDDTLTGTMTARPANTRLENMSSEAPRSARLVRAWRVLSALACMAAFFPFFSIALTQITLSLLLIVWFGIVARGGRRGALPFVTPMLVWLIATVITTLTALDVGLAFGARNDAVWLFALWPPRLRVTRARARTWHAAWRWVEHSRRSSHSRRGRKRVSATASTGPSPTT